MLIIIITLQFSTVSHLIRKDADSSGSESPHVKESKTVCMDCGFRILGVTHPLISYSLSVELGVWIPIVSGILDQSLTCILDSKAQDSAFY